MLEFMLVLLIVLGLFFFFAGITCAAVLGCVERTRQYRLDHKAERPQETVAFSKGR